jgi:hypothetical protein
MQAESLSYVSTGEPTYWPGDRRKVGDLIDFGVAKRIPLNSLHAESSFDLSSDHSPVIITTHSRIIPQTSPPTLSAHTHTQTHTHTNWETFRNHIRENLTLDAPLKFNRDIEDYVHQFVHIIQQAAWNSTPNPDTSLNADECAPMIKQKIFEKRKLRKGDKTPGRRKI